MGIITINRDLSSILFMNGNIIMDKYNKMSEESLREFSELYKYSELETKVFIIDEWKILYKIKKEIINNIVCYYIKIFSRTKELEKIEKYMPIQYY